MHQITDQVTPLGSSRGRKNKFMSYSDSLCFFVNGSQCSQPYLCIAHMPAIGTPINNVPSIPSPIELSIVCRMNITIIQKAKLQIKILQTYT